MEKIRITAGELKGRSIRSPQSVLTHPMGTREKLALFNMIGDSVSRARVLDAFSGSGALGIEALSRGAEFVVLVEKNPRVAEVIKENLRSLGLETRGQVFSGDVTGFEAEEQFEIIIADPPYGDFRVEKVNYLGRFLKSGGILVLSHPGEAPELSGLELVKTRKYAAARISVYKRVQ